MLLRRVQATFQEGGKGTTSHRIFFTNATGSRVSPWHQIPLRVARSQLYNFVAEVPKGCVAPACCCRCFLPPACARPRRAASVTVLSPMVRCGRSPCEWLFDGCRSARDKYEIATKEAFNPIKFDLSKKGEPRWASCGV